MNVSSQGRVVVMTITMVPRSAVGESSTHPHHLCPPVVSDPGGTVLLEKEEVGEDEEEEEAAATSNAPLLWLVRSHSQHLHPNSPSL